MPGLLVEVSNLLVFKNLVCFNADDHWMNTADVLILFNIKLHGWRFASSDTGGVDLLHALGSKEHH